MIPLKIAPTLFREMPEARLHTKGSRASFAAIAFLPVEDFP
ncbi:hypothetical protein QO005_001177 [Rhizobium paknamense]|uniref:Uncharacterized protein n=1 Tax=Rhizobium paknamense TaxID=1206817 RepID=A0ABU0IBJ6_9HYPH|nr:hypothetical protein [Rhizobium paknamense]